MKKLILSLSMFLSAILFGQDFGSISVDASPGICWVKIDSVIAGKTPLVGLKLSAGKHTVEVYPAQKGIWQVTHKYFKVDVLPHQTTQINALFDPPVYVNASPFGAQVYLDTTKIGVAPLYLDAEKYSGKTFRIEKNGYKTHTFKLNSQKSIMVALDRENEAEELRQPPKFLGFVQKRRLKSKFSLLALSVATHWAAFYFKNEADQNFQKYESTGNAALADQYWNETQKFDTWSDMSLGVSYASLAGLIYMVVLK